MFLVHGFIKKRNDKDSKTNDAADRGKKLQNRLRRNGQPASLKEAEALVGAEYEVLEDEDRVADAYFKTNRRGRNE